VQVGAAFYASRFPERWKPGAFDLALHSHQLFHVAVVVAAVIHYKASSVLLHWRDATGGCMLLAPPPPAAALGLAPLGAAL
jgi:adiponectin receptor